MSGGEEDTGGDKTVSFAPEEEKSAKVLQQKLSMLQKQHELQSVSNSLSFPKPVTRLVFWTRPKQRQRWGDVDSHCHINWGDLFFDLFYVAFLRSLEIIFFLRKRFTKGLVRIDSLN